MVVKINKNDELFVDGAMKQIKDIDSQFLDSLFLELLRKNSSIIIEDENNCGYLGRLFIEIRNAAKPESDFYIKYNELKDEYNKVIKEEKQLQEEEI